MTRGSSENPRGYVSTPGFWEVALAVTVFSAWQVGLPKNSSLWAV